MKDLINPEENQKEMLGIVLNDGNQNNICKAKEASSFIIKIANVLDDDNINYYADIEKKVEVDI